MNQTADLLDRDKLYELAARIAAMPGVEINPLVRPEQYGSRQRLVEIGDDGAWLVIGDNAVELMQAVRDLLFALDAPRAQAEFECLAIYQIEPGQEWRLKERTFKYPSVDISP
jgi:hypothetical protein